MRLIIQWLGFTYTFAITLDAFYEFPLIVVVAVTHFACFVVVNVFAVGIAFIEISCVIHCAITAHYRKLSMGSSVDVAGGVIAPVQWKIRGVFPIEFGTSGIAQYPQSVQSARFQAHTPFELAIRVVCSSVAVDLTHAKRPNIMYRTVRKILDVVAVFKSTFVGY